MRIPTFLIKTHLKTWRRDSYDEIEHISRALLYLKKIHVDRKITMKHSPQNRKRKWHGRTQ